jgi:hypothetical protein
MPEDMAKLLENAETYRRVLIDPVIASLRTELESQMKPLIAQQLDHSARIAANDRQIDALNTKWAGAMKGLSVYATALSLAVGAGLNWIKGKLHI